MAINPDPSLPNRHAIVCGATGCGKSQALGQLLLPKGYGHRVILWDPDEDHRAHRFERRAPFARALVAGVRSGKGFRLAYSGPVTPDEFEWWCNLVWTALDGSRLTHVVVEELADVCPSAGKATPAFGQLLRKGRKYGAVISMATQRGTEVPKTAWTQVSQKIIGQQEANDRARIAKEASVDPATLAALKPLQFLIKPSGADPATQKALKYKPRPPMRSGYV